MIVVDASIWVLALVGDEASGGSAREVVGRDPSWSAPSHCRVEVLRTLRRYEVGKILPTASADVLAAGVLATQIRLYEPDGNALAWIWGNRHNLALYDAHYVYLAGKLGVPLVTADRRLAVAAAQLGVEVVVPA